LGLCLILLIPCWLDLHAVLLRVLFFEPDVELYYDAAAHYLRNPSVPLYTHPSPGYLYPPFFLVLMAPLTRLTPEMAAVVFHALKWVALLFCFWNAWRLCSPRGEDLPPIVTVGTIVLSWRFIQNDFAHANVNTFIVFLVLLSCWLVLKQRDFLAGVAIGIATCIKVTPALFALYFAYKGRWRSLWGVMVAALVCLLILPAATVGWNNNLRDLTDWFRIVVLAYLQGNEIKALAGNQSLASLIDRLFGAGVYTEPDLRITLVVLPKAAVNGIKVLAAAVVLCVWAWTCRGRLRSDTPPLALGSEAGLTLIVMLLLSGISWKAHFVSLLLANAALLAYLADRRYPGPRRAIRWLLAASFAAVLLSSDLIGPRGRDYAEAYGVVALAAVLAATGLIRLRQNLRLLGEQPAAGTVST